MDIRTNTPASLVFHVSFTTTPTNPYPMNMTRLLTLVWLLGITPWLIGRTEPDLVLSDDLEGAALNAPPSQWTTSDNWQVKEIGGNRLVGNYNSSAGAGRTLTHQLDQPITDACELDLDFDWEWGGSSSQGYGFYTMSFEIDLVDDTGNGYRLRVRQGTHSAAPSANDNKVVEILKLTAGSPTVLAQGPGYNESGWKTAGLSAPAFKPVRLFWEKTSGKLLAYVDGDGDGSLELSTSVSDTTFSYFTKIIVAARGYTSNEVPQLDNLKVRSFLLREDFEGAPLDVAPSQWTTSDNWQVKSYGGNKVACNFDSSSGSGRPIFRQLAAEVTDAWSVDFEYDWQWGGSNSSTPPFGFYALAIDIALTDNAGNGYMVRVNQGTHSSTPNANDDRVLQIFKMTTGTPSLLAEGQGYNVPGWKTRGLSEPTLMPVRFSWDKSTGQLRVYANPDGIGDLDYSVGVIDTTFTSFTRLTMSTSGFTSNERPTVDNLVVTSPRKRIWGMCGHPSWPEYTAIGQQAQIDLIKSLGCSYYRVDTWNESIIDSLLPIAQANGVELLPIVYRGLDIFATQADGVTPVYSLTDIYNSCYQSGLAFGQKYNGVFDYVEVDNEMVLRCIVPGTHGNLTSHYDDSLPMQRFSRCLQAIKGLSDGLRAGDPEAKQLVGAAGWYHYGFLDRLIAEGVTFDVLSWHWYSNMGSLSRVMHKLTSYGVPIWITETNRKHGSLYGEYLINDLEGETLNAPPSQWTTSDNWQVKEIGGNRLVGNYNSSAGAGRTLTHQLDQPITDACEVDLDFDWEWGGSSSQGYGFYTMSFEIDLVDDTGNGYRLRVRQGTHSAAPSTNDNKVVEILKLTAGSPTVLAQGPGYNESGWKTAGLSAPDFKPVRLFWEKTSGKLLAYVDGDGDGSLELSTSVSDTTFSYFTKIIVAARGYTSNEVPQLDNLKVYTGQAGQEDQASQLAIDLNEMAGFPAIEAVFVYELLDESRYGYDKSEANYGLYTIAPHTSGSGWQLGTGKLAAQVVADTIAAVGPHQTGDADLVIDDTYQGPAIVTSLPDVWQAEDSGAGYLGGYLHDNNTNKGNTVRFYPFVPVSGDYTVAVRWPASTSHASNVPVTVRDATGTHTLTINEQSQGETWTPVGVYAFEATDAGGASPQGISSTAPYVEIGNTGTAQRVAVDAVKLVPEF